ncbi:DUF2894 domain-containing protein [Rhodoferax sp.]|uniref:DUF2894 domain-containing protein n=1 Tax=Rhodoferax sp. TaxID=50421 RepID=UPI0027347D8B|nr:DUF2894 domain-containing protein [Rhodoferax sp.]MDP3191682.1 DUF2894 domain-containing protein [Rhodoferax sp.]MDP3338199.1 DUF2894 domain-containing protein [Rhodoferax sp.]
MSAPARDFQAQLADLCLAGAAQHDPVTCHYLQALLERAGRHQGEVRRLLDVRLGQALQTFQRRFELAQREASPASVGQESRASGASLRELIRYIAQHAQQQADTSQSGVLQSATRSRPELKSVRQFRNTWSKLSVDRQVAKALRQGPQNAGPINSHRLVLASLALMREISPDYLNRFMCYADALLCLDQSGQARSAPAKKSSRAKAVKK